jgi:hypothetical protein
MSPAGKAQCFAVQRGEITKRFEPRFYAMPDYLLHVTKFSRYPTITLGEVFGLIESGSPFPRCLSAPCGIPVLEVKGIMEDGISCPSEFTTLVDSKCLRPHDIVTGRVGSIGTFHVVLEGMNWAFSDNVLRLRVSDEHQLLPQFFANIMLLPSCLGQLQRGMKQALQPVINQATLRTILFPLPPLAKQRELVAAMDAARASRRAKRAEAEALLAGMDAVLIKALGLEDSPPSKRRVFAVHAQEARIDGRLNADYYHPERILAIRAMKAAMDWIPCHRLADVVSFERNQIKTPGENYMSLAHVQSNTGELVPCDEEAGGSCITFKAADVLFARLRPYLNKVHRAEIDGCCSPEFHVMRVKDMSRLSPDYLAAILRSRLILAQTIHMMTGNTHPRLANEDVTELVVPIPPLALQKTIAAEHHRRRDEARRLRQKAEADWQRAKAEFEAALLGKG